MSRSFRCAACGKEVLKTGRNHRYCAECAKQRALADKRKYARKYRESIRLMNLAEKAVERLNEDSENSEETR